MIAVILLIPQVNCSNKRKLSREKSSKDQSLFLLKNQEFLNVSNKIIKKKSKSSKEI
jgi:hypothetical protein